MDGVSGRRLVSGKLAEAVKGDRQQAEALQALNSCERLEDRVNREIVAKISFIRRVINLRSEKFWKNMISCNLRNGSRKGK